MNAVHALPLQPEFAPLANEDVLDRIVDAFHDKMLGDYRVNRFFNNKPAAEQSTPLKALVKAATFKPADQDIDWTTLLDAYFMAAFARNNAKPSLVTGNDFMFLLDVIGGEQPAKPMPLCEAHGHLLKLAPNDSHYDAAMEHLTAALQEADASANLANRLLEMGKNARDGLLGRHAA